MTDGYPPPVRLNRYLAAAGLGDRRSVEGLIRAGRVTVDGAVADDPAIRVGAGVDVRVDGAPADAGRALGAVLNRPPGAPIALVHPASLVPTLALPAGKGGMELLLADPDLAARVGDPRFPQAERFRAGRRVRVAGIDLGEVPEGAWRPLTPAEHRKLRLGVRLPPGG